jgi:hypothetical protein
MASPTPKPTPKPTLPPNVVKANAAANNSLPSTIIPKPTSTKTTKSPAPVVGKTPTGLEPVKIGSSTDWNQFLDGTLVPVTTGPNGVAIEPYVAGQLPSAANPNPGGIAVLPNADGTGFYTDSVDAIASQSMLSINAGNIQTYKLKLAAYYPSQKEFKLSYATTDKDAAFQKAIKRAINEASVANFGYGTTNANALKANPNSPLPVNLYTFDSYVLSRPDAPITTSTSQSDIGLTTREDALAEFYRTVQSHVGEPALVNNLPILAEAYWNKLHTTELNRGSTRTTVSSPLGGGTSTGVQYVQLSELDRLEMRINFITKGGSAKDKAGNVVKSTGIKGVDYQKLQDTGGLIGDNYTKLLEHSYDMGVPVNKDDLVTRAAKALLPGGSVDEQIKSLTQAAKAHYSTLGTYIDSGLKVSDIASFYQKTRDAELELAPGTTDIFNDNVQKAIKGPSLMDQNDYLLGIRTDPNWRFTKSANESSAGFIDAILKTWGKVGM